MKAKSENIEMFASQLKGIALDWAMGVILNRKMKLFKAGESTFTAPCVCHYVSEKKLESDVIQLPKLVPYRPTEDWELLPDDYRESYDYAYYTTLTTKSVYGESSRDIWIAVREYHEEGEPIEYDFHEGDTKLEAICKAYVADKMRIIDIPVEVLDCM